MEDNTTTTPVAGTPAATVAPVTTPAVATKAATKTLTTVPAPVTSSGTGVGKTEIGLAAAALLLVALVVLFATRGRTKTGGKSTGGKDAAPAKSNGDVVEIYVGNLSYDMTEAQFRKEFERFGVVKSARVIGHRTSGKSKGYGFVEMPHRKEALVAIKALNNRDVMGRKLRVNEARSGTREED